MTEYAWWSTAAFKIGRNSMHVYGQRNICIWLTQETSHQVDDIPFKSIPFNSSNQLYSHIFQKLSKLDWSIDENDNCERRFRISAILRNTSGQMRITDHPLSNCKAFRKTLLCNFRSWKGEACKRCAMHHRANERASIFDLLGKNGQWRCVSANGSALLIKDLD